MTSSLAFGIANITVRIISKYRLKVKGILSMVIGSVKYSQYTLLVTADKGKSVPMERNVAYELHHPQPQRTSTEQTDASPVYDVV